MKVVNIRELKHETSAIMEQVAMGQSIEIRKRNRPVALLKPLPGTGRRHSRPDFRKRLYDIYGHSMLKTTATELIAEERGDK